MTIFKMILNVIRVQNDGRFLIFKMVFFVHLLGVTRIISGEPRQIKFAEKLTS